MTEFDGGDRKIVTVNGREVVVFRWADRYHAYENQCLQRNILGETARQVYNLEVA